MQVIQIPFAGGIEEKTAAEYVDPATALLDAVNLVYTKDGALDKRLGVAPLTATQILPSLFPVMGAPIKALSRGPEVLSTDGDSLFAYAPGTPPGWSWRSLVSPCQATRAESFATPTNYAGSTFAEGAGRRLWVARSGGASGGTIYYWVQDIASSSWIVTAIQLASGSLFGPRVIHQAGHFCVFWTDNTNVRGAVIAGDGSLVTSATTIVSDMQTSGPPCFDATIEAGGTGILLIYPQKGSGSDSSPRYLRLESLPALTVTSSAVLIALTGASVTGCACRYDGTLGVVWFFWETLTPGVGPTYTLAYKAFTTSWSPIAAAQALTAMPVYGASSSVSGQLLMVEPLTTGSGTAAQTQALFIAHPVASAIPSQGAGVQVIANADGSASGGAAAEYTLLTQTLSRPFRATVGGYTRCYLLAQLTQQSFGATGSSTGNASGYTTSTVLLDTMAIGSYSTPGNVATAAVNPRVVSVIAPRQSALQAGLFAMNDLSASIPTGIGSPAQGVFRVPVATVASEEFAEQAAIGTSNTWMTWGVSQFDFTNGPSFQYCEGNDESLVSGGFLGFDDGLGIFEASFFSWPTVTSWAQGTGGSLTTTGVYQYAVCWAYQDNQGLIHRSPFWNDQVTLSGSNDQVTVTVPELPFSARNLTQNTCVLEVYRSVNNGTTLYYLGSTVVGGLGTGGGTLSYTDSAADTSITTNALQPTTGGVLDSVCPPAARAVWRHVDRAWLIDDTGTVVWFSTPFNQAEAPFFNESLALTFTQETLTAGTSMDDKVVLFSGESIWYVEGYGPPNTGVGTDLTTAVRVPTDTGAADWRSVVTVPSVGVFFVSGLNGLPYLLDRGLNVACIGKQVQDWFVASPGVAATTVLGSSVVPLTTQIRFVLSTGYVATYDYTLQRWSRQQYAVNMTHAVVPSGGPWTSVGSGRVYQENAPSIAAPYFDTLAGGGTQWITPTITLAWLKPGGLQGWAHVELVQAMSRTLDPSNVIVQLAANYNPAILQTNTFTAGNIAAQSAAVAQVRVTPGNTLSEPQSLQVTLSEAPPTGASATTGRGQRWLGVAFGVTSLGPIYETLGVGVKQ